MRITLTTYGDYDRMMWDSLRKPIPKIPRRRSPLVPILAPDVLYKIFSFAVYSSNHPGTTALALSQVCRHWRTYALMFPSLWAFVDLHFPSLSMVTLFLERCGNAPLTLSWVTESTFSGSLFELRLRRPSRDFFNSSSMPYFESRRNHILPRLSDLTLHLTHAEFNQIIRLFRAEFPLRLQCLDIEFYRHRHGPESDEGAEQELEDANAPPWTDLLQVDLSYLRRLKLEKTPLSWSVYLSDKLTYLKLWHPIHLPTIDQLLVFLSHCPLLTELEIGLSEREAMSSERQWEESAIDEITFPKLTTLKLESRGEWSYYLIQELSTCLSESELLTSFDLTCYEPPVLLPDSDDGDMDVDTDQEPTYWPSNILNVVPSWMVAYLASSQYVYISFSYYSGEFIFHTDSCFKQDPSRNGLIKPRRSDHLEYTSGSPFSISMNEMHDEEEELRRLFDRSPLLELMHAMSQIYHLVLVDDALEALTSWNIDISVMFPCLDTLQLVGVPPNSDDRRDCTDALKQLPPGLKLKELIFEYLEVSSSQVLLDVVRRTGVKSLKLLDISSVENQDEVISIVEGWGVDVIEEPWLEY